MKKIPEVSVIMTVYNGEKYLAEAIESIRQQSLSNFEFVIVDDGSEDQTPEILKRKAKADPRIKVISEGRIGRMNALNLAWTRTKGDYVANLDADDMAEPRRLEKQVSFLKQNPNVGLVGTACKVIDEVNGTIHYLSFPLTDSELRKKIVRLNPFFHSSVMLPRTVLEKVGGYKSQFTSGIDYSLWLRISSRYQLANLSDVLMIKRLHKNNYFTYKIPIWERYKARVANRFYAWRMFSKQIPDFFFVISPLPKKRTLWVMLQQLLMKSRKILTKSKR